MPVQQNKILLETPVVYQPASSNSLEPCNSHRVPGSLVIVPFTNTLSRTRAKFCGKKRVFKVIPLVLQGWR